MSFIRSFPLRFSALVAICWLVIFLLTRGFLLSLSLQDVALGPAALASTFLSGSLYDLAFVIYLALGITLVTLPIPARFWPRRGGLLAARILFFILAYVMCFTAVAEWLFWDEFGVRFNFIAVDYLIYSDEVINNIRESYPLGKLLTGIGVISLALTFGLSKRLQQMAKAPVIPFKSRLLELSGLLGLSLLTGLVISQDFPAPQEGNTYQKELSGNGPYQFFAAFRNNEILYPQFYATLPDEAVAQTLRASVASPNSQFIGEKSIDIRRTINNHQPETLNRPNVILVTIESLSARYLGVFGNTRGLTPHLDQLKKDSLLFTQLYATGTRTDRGLEAITLSIPPTPGRSIVKRIGRESGYGSLGQQFNAKGYDSVFIYGGRGYFDNMNTFFAGNGYRIVDQSSIPENEIDFKNAWGVSDEVLYQQAMKVADVDHAANKPFFLQLMTTSNHRPYTYPDGRIDIPSGKGRDGAVKYTDYAIGAFLDAARKKPWFDNTLFIFIADHTAGSAGKEDLPVANYHIPMFMYAPKLIRPGTHDQLTSQIDLAPTLLGLLHFNYTSTFFGQDVFQQPAPTGRALIGNYQHLGLFDGEDLAILSPRRVIRRHDHALKDSIERTADTSDPLVARNIAYYQGASYLFRHKMLLWQDN